MRITHIEYSIATKSIDIFFSGCRKPLCKGCCNPELIDFNVGQYWIEKQEELTKYLTDFGSLIERVFLVGGSPNHQNIEQMRLFLEELKKYNKDVYLFAREELQDINSLFFTYCSHIKTGEYIPELTCSDNNQYGVHLATSNQKIFKKGIDY